jgi:excisionase family DNA binding protein
MMSVMSDQTTSDPVELLTPNELAAMLKVHLRTVMRYLADGRVPSIKIGGARRIEKNAAFKALGL